MSAQTFEELDIWKRGCRQAVTVCRLIQDWRNFALRDQMTRAAVSVPSNVAEGYERDSDGGFRRFLRIAKGSNAELRTQLYIASELGLSTMLHAEFSSANPRKSPPCFKASSGPSNAAPSL